MIRCPSSLAVVACALSSVSHAASPSGDDVATDAPGPCVVALVDLSKVIPLGPEADPFSDRPVDDLCEPEALQFEELGGEPVFSVETGACAYATTAAPLTVSLAPGDIVEARVWHFSLFGPNAEAHVAVRVGDIDVLDERVAIPGESGLSLASATLESVQPAGTLVYFHLHNHGANSWSWLGLRRKGCAACSST